MVQLSVLCTAAGYGVLVVLALFSLKRGNRRANFYLGVFTLLVSISVILHALLYSRVTNAYPHLHLVYASFGFLYGPLLYFHLGALTDPAGNWSWPVLFKRHGLAFLALLIYQLPFFFFSADQKRAVLEQGFIYFRGDQVAYDLLQNLSLLAYLTASAVLVADFGKLRDEKNSLHTAIQRWCWAVLGYIAVAVVMALLQSVSGGLFQLWLLPLACAGFFGLTGYFWFLFPETFISVLSPGSDPESKSKYKRSGLRDEDSAKYEEKLLRAMEAERYYLDADLSLRDLAERLKVNPVYLSQVINEKLGKSFFDFVNSYRIRAAVDALSSLGPDRTILDIAYKVGFNSKSTFYSAFKKEMGTTPGEFLKRRAAPLSGTRSES